MDESFTTSFVQESTQAESLVDILVCTPGRLMDHIQATPGFTLQHLQFLVRVFTRSSPSRYACMTRSEEERRGRRAEERGRMQEEEEEPVSLDTTTSSQK